MKINRLLYREFVKHITMNVDSNITSNIIFDIAYKGIKGMLISAITSNHSSDEGNIFYAHYAWTSFNQPTRTRWYDCDVRNKMQRAVIPYFEKIHISHESITDVGMHFKYRERLI